MVEALGLRDTLIEVDLTPNRPDCASVLGIAREVAGFIGSKLKPPIIDTPSEPAGVSAPFKVVVEEPDDCPRYMAKLLTGVTIAPSPWWLRKRLLAVGLRPINNVVDITNYVLLEYGQPLHAFDCNKLTGAKIVVRKPQTDEKIVTIDGVERTLDPQMLLICDAEKPVAVAGVMGGENTEVSDTTTDVLLECAYFNPISIRRTSRALKLGTDSSYRFERGVDPQGMPKALERVVRLMVDICGAEVAAGGVDIRQEIPLPSEISLRVRKTCDLLGMEMNADEIAGLLNSIEINTTITDAQMLTVRPPSFRVDLEREIDLIEEIARLKGYNEIPTCLPIVPMRFAERDANRILSKQVGDIMISLGFHEAINYSFISENYFDMLGLAPDDPLRATVRLLNPITEDQNVMRSTLLPILIENVRNNINHQNTDVRLYEIGKTFLQTGGVQPKEAVHLTCLLSGRRSPEAPALHFGDMSVDIYDVKGMAETILDGLRLTGSITFDIDAKPKTYVEQGSSISLKSGNREIGNFGQINAHTRKAFGIKQDLFFLDVNLDDLAALNRTPKKFAALPKYPSVKWDIAILVPEQTRGGEMIQAIYDLREGLVERAEIFDIYQGKNIEPGRKSIAISISYRSKKQTLNDEMVNAVHEKIIDTIVTRFQGKLREA